MKTIIGLFLTFSLTVAQSSADKQFDHLVDQVSSEAQAERVAFNKKYIEVLEIIPKRGSSKATRC